MKWNILHKNEFLLRFEIHAHLELKMTTSDLFTKIIVIRLTLSRKVV